MLGIEKKGCEVNWQRRRCLRMRGAAPRSLPGPGLDGRHTLAAAKAAGLGTEERMHCALNPCESKQAETIR